MSGWPQPGAARWRQLPTRKTGYASQWRKARWRWRLARRFSLTLGRALALALLVEHAQWSLDHEHDARARAAALWFAQSGIDQLNDFDADAAFALADDN